MCVGTADLFFKLIIIQHTSKNSELMCQRQSHRQKEDKSIPNWLEWFVCNGQGGQRESRHRLSFDGRLPGLQHQPKHTTGVPVIGWLIASDDIINNVKLMIHQIIATDNVMTTGYVSKQNPFHRWSTHRSIYLISLLSSMALAKPMTTTRAMKPFWTIVLLLRFNMKTIRGIIAQLSDELDYDILKVRCRK